MSPMLGMLLQQAYSNLQAGRADQARSILQGALQLAPDNVDALHLSGLVESSLGRHAEALTHFGRALARKQDAPAIRVNASSSLRVLRRYDEALAMLDRLLGMAPSMAAAHHNRGNLLREMRRFAEALTAFDSAIRLAPEDPDSHAARASVHFARGDYAAAREGYVRALGLQPDHADALWNLSLIRLLHGEMPSGWTGYEAGGGLGTRDILRGFGRPVWQGGSLAGQRILLHAEQGLGDTLQFCRYVALVKAQGAAEVVLEAPASLICLLQGLAGLDRIFARGSALPDFDLSCPLLSLPGIFGTTLASVPPPAILSLPASAPSFAQDRSSGAPRIGVVWAGNPAHVNDRERSASFHLVETLLSAGPEASWYSLQKSPSDADRAAMRRCAALNDPASGFDSFSTTAACLQELDLLISVDTSVAHLAATLGKPVWLLLPPVPDWRWLLDREDSPWYPSMRLFRRREDEDWNAMAARMLLPALQEWLNTRKGTADE